MEGFRLASPSFKAVFVASSLFDVSIVHQTHIGIIGDWLKPIGYTSLSTLYYFILLLPKYSEGGFDPYVFYPSSLSGLHWPGHLPEYHEGCLAEFFHPLKWLQWGVLRVPGVSKIFGHGTDVEMMWNWSGKHVQHGKRLWVQLWSTRFCTEIWAIRSIVLSSATQTQLRAQHRCRCRRSCATLGELRRSWLAWQEDQAWLLRLQLKLGPWKFQFFRCGKILAPSGRFATSCSLLEAWKKDICGNWLWISDTRLHLGNNYQ